MIINKHHVVVSMQGDKQTVDSGWDSILGRVERGCPLDKVMFGQRPEWGKRDDVWMSWGRVPANYDDPGDQSMAGKFKEEQRGPGGRVQWVRGKSGSWGQRQRGGPDHVRAGRQQQDFAHTLSQGQPLKSPEQRSIMGPLVFEKN